MLVLHAAWLEGRIHLWAERSLAGKRVARRPSGQPPPAPADAGRTGLVRAVEAVVGAALAQSSRRSVTCVAWLPTQSRQPVPSHPGLASSPAGPRQHGPLPLAPWRVTALALEWTDASLVLSALSAGAQGRLLARGVLAGNDLAAWSDVWRYAGALVARQVYLPDLVATSKGYESRWQPVLHGAETPRVQALATRLPAAALCLAPQPAPPGRATAQAGSAEAALRAFLHEAVDFLVRRAASTTLTRAHAARGQFASVHDAWLAALRSDVRLIRWEHPDDLRALQASVMQWRQPVDAGDSWHYRVGFRLVEPPAKDVAAAQAAWHLHYLLVPLDQSGTIEPLLAVCQDPATPARLRVFALTALGQAASLCPLIAAAAADDGAGPAPASTLLTSSQAHAFLTRYAALLADAGFAVETPAWWQAARDRPRLEVRGHAAPPPGTDPDAPLARDALVAVRWEVALGDTALTIEEIEALGRAEAPLVACHGRWIEVDRVELTAARRIVRSQRSDLLPLRDVLRLALGAGGQAHGLAVHGLVAEHSVRALIDRLQEDAVPVVVTQPAGFVGQLRPYQERGLAWLCFLRRWGLGACLADDMGLGKTIQALALLAHAREQGETRPALLICPTSVIGNWMREAARFTPNLRVLVHHGPARDRGESLTLSARAHDLVVTSYTLLYRDFTSLRRVPWSGALLDEAQNIKNPATRQSQAARALEADYRVVLTGTPVENHVGDLWTIMDFLNPGLLGARAAFRSQIQVPLQTGVDPEARDRLRRLIRPFVLRRLKSDPAVGVDLPEKSEQKCFCPLTREQAGLYAAELRQLDSRLTAASGIARRGLVLATLTRLKQICNHPAHFLADGSALEGRSGKLARLEAMVGEMLETGDRGLIFTQFVTMGRLLQEHLRETFGCEAPLLHGGLNRFERDRLVDRFQTPDGPPFFILSLRAGGTGLNLTAANHVFHYDRWWNPAVEAQATDRAHRIGQSRRVMVHTFVCAGTLEERIDQMITAKSSLAAELLGSGETWLTELSNAELREVLALAADAVVDDTSG